jgi:hemerythrin-like domain-containing protein
MPLKRHPALQDYSREHHDELLLVWKIRTGLKNNISSERISDYCVHHYNQVTGRHMAKEEKFILSKLPEQDDDRIKILNDHTAIKELAKKISENLSDNKLLAAFAEKLEQHIRFEERILFQRLQDSLSEATLKSMQPSEKKPLECSVWKDEFWEK